jgi:hypothetical protein
MKWLYDENIALHEVNALIWSEVAESTTVTDSIPRHGGN